MRRIGFAVLWLLSPIALAQACQGLINCSFETPALSSGAYLYNPSGTGVAWTFAGTTGIQRNGSAWGAATAPDGRQTAFVQGVGSMSQTVNLNAGSYTLSFQAARRAAGCCTSPYVQPVRVTVDGAQIGSLVTPPSTSFSLFSISFSVAASGAHTFAFTGTVSEDKTTFIDVVSVVGGGGGGTTSTTTSLSSSLNPSTVGMTVTFTAMVTGNAPTGSVAFTDGGGSFGCAAIALSGSGNTRTAQCSTSSLAAGTHSIVAAYNGDIANAASVSPPLAQAVNSTPSAGTPFNSFEVSSAPNSPVPVDALTAASAATDADIAIVPKGVGAILGEIPDGTVANGDKRGPLATDFQRSRLYSSDVASGYGATISGGANNIASGLYATVVGGYDNEASGHVAVVGGHSSIASGSGSPVAFGYDAVATGDSAVALGHNPEASGTDSVAIGRQNVATQDNSVAIGWDSLSDATQAMALGVQAVTRSIHGAFAFANGQIAARGDAQRGMYILKAVTATGTPTQLTTDAVTPALSRGNVLALPDLASYAFSGKVIARDIATGDTAWWKVEGMAKRGVGAVTVTQVSTVTPVNRDSGANTWGLALAADTANGSLALIGTGQSGKTVQWVGVIDTVENIGN